MQNISWSITLGHKYQFHQQGLIQNLELNLNSKDIKIFTQG